MTVGPERPSGRSRLQKQAIEIIEEDTSAVALVENLDFGFMEANDQYADWHASTPLLPMVRAMLLKEIEDLSFTELHRRLDADSTDARALGFEELPARTTFGRTWRDRFDDDLQHKIGFNARKIRELAHERGRSIGLQAIEPEEKAEASQRTRDRFIN